MSSPVCPICSSAQHVVEDPTTGRRCFTCAACGRAFVLPAAVTASTPAHEDDLRAASREARVAVSMIDLGVQDRADGYNGSCDDDITAARERLDAATTALGGVTVADFRAVLDEVLGEEMPIPGAPSTVRDWIDGALLIRAETLLSRTSPRCSRCADRGTDAGNACECAAGERYRTATKAEEVVKAAAQRPNSSR